MQVSTRTSTVEMHTDCQYYRVAMEILPGIIYLILKNRNTQQSKIQIGHTKQYETVLISTPISPGGQQDEDMLCRNAISVHVQISSCQRTECRVQSAGCACGLQLFTFNFVWYFNPSTSSITPSVCADYIS